MDFLNEEIKKIEQVPKNLEKAAKEFTADLNKLSKPYSQIRKSGYTHLVRCFTYQKKKEEIEVGWGKYYGPFVERTQPHFHPLFEKNKEKYLSLMWKG